MKFFKSISRAKKLIIFASSFFIFLTQAEPAIKQGTIEFWRGNYSLDDPRFQAVYPKSGPIYGLTFSANLLTPLNFYLEIKYFRTEGSLTYTKEKSEFHLLPVSFGLKAVIPIGILNPFCGAGTDIYTYYEKNPIGTVLNYSRGFHFLAGLYLQAGKLPLFISARLKYTKAKAEEEKGRQVQLGGFETSLGFGFIF